MYNVYYLFLDIDGVLQTPSLGDFIEMEHEGTLAAWLLEQPNVSVVLTSSHREGLTLEQLKARFSPAVAQRIVGMTAQSPLGRAYGGRQREIEAWMKTAPVPNAPWVAVDDEPLLFDQPCGRLVHTHPWTGLLPESLDEAWSILTGKLLERKPATTPRPAAAQKQPALASAAEKLSHLQSVKVEGAAPRAQRHGATNAGSSTSAPSQGWFARTLARLGL